jgi:hypothetical protein
VSFMGPSWLRPLRASGPLARLLWLLSLPVSALLIATAWLMHWPLAMQVPWTFWIVAIAVINYRYIYRRRSWRLGFQQPAPAAQLERPYVAGDPLLVLYGCPAHLGFDLTRNADIYVYPGEFGVRLRKYVVSQPGDGVLLRQVGGVVRMNVARLPPWIDTAIFIEDAGQRCLVVMGRSKRSQLVKALGRAGLEIRYQRRSIFGLSTP